MARISKTCVVHIHRNDFIELDNLLQAHCYYAHVLCTTFWP